MREFVDLPVETAHRIINHGPVVLVSTRDESGSYDVAPIAWTSPVHKTPPRLLVVVGRRHKTHANIKATGEFIVCVPGLSQVEMVKKTGSVSGKEVDKFSEFDIDTIRGNEIDALVPKECVGFIECRIVESIEIGLVDIFVGEPVSASVDKAAYDERLLTEKEAGKTLHHLGGRIFAVPSDSVEEA